MLHVVLPAGRLWLVGAGGEGSFPAGQCGQGMREARPAVRRREERPGEGESDPTGRWEERGVSCPAGPVLSWRRRAESIGCFGPGLHGRAQTTHVSLTQVGGQLLIPRLRRRRRPGGEGLGLGSGHGLAINADVAQTALCAAQLLLAGWAAAAASPTAP